MIYATCNKGDTIIVQRNAHKSIFHAIELVGAKPILCRRYGMSGQCRRHM